MSNPISLAFKKAKQENRAALLTYTVAGDSSKRQSLDILNSISKNADILEFMETLMSELADTPEELRKLRSSRRILNQLQTRAGREIFWLKSRRLN